MLMEYCLLVRHKVNANAVLNANAVYGTVVRKSLGICAVENHGTISD